MTHSWCRNETSLIRRSVAKKIWPVDFYRPDDFVTITAFDDNALGEDDMRITLPWLSGRHPGNSDPLGQIWHAVHDRIEQHIMEIEDDE